MDMIEKHCVLYDVDEPAAKANVVQTKRAHARSSVFAKANVFQTKPAHARSNVLAKANVFQTKRAHARSTFFKQSALAKANVDQAYAQKNC